MLTEILYAYKNDEVLLSVESKRKYSDEYIMMKEEGEEKRARNVSKCDHITFHSEFIPARKYKRNRKHGKTEYSGKRGITIAQMDLDDEQAQMVLNHAVSVDKRIFGVFQGAIYEFKNSNDGTYHGYRNESISKDMRMKIEKCLRRLRG